MKRKTNDEKSKTLKAKMDDPVFDNAHMAGQILETNVLADFYRNKSGNRIKLNSPGNLVSYGDIKSSGGTATFSYGGINIEVKSSPQNTNDVQSSEVKVINPNFFLKR